MRLAWFVATLFQLPCSGQIISFGVKGGLPVTSVSDSASGLTRYGGVSNFT
jgi:hypothetical protein